MSYKNDIFISYVRSEETRRWLEDHFIPLLRDHLALELGATPTIFYDKQLEIGTKWPTQLAEELSKSKLLIALWSSAYLKSAWCTAEISHICQREESAGIANKANLNGLILPMIVHDGDSIPHELSVYQNLDLKDCFNSRMHIYSPKAEILSDRILSITHGIFNRLNSIPNWDPNWYTMAYDKFYDLFHVQSNAAQIRMPKFN